MIDRVPYNSTLTPIGNENVYDGKPVYTDGRIVYGWHFVPQSITPAPAVVKSGFWVGEETGFSYQLARKNLELGKKIASKLHGSVQAYPSYATIELTGGYLPEHGQVVTATGSYLYRGAIVAMDGVGRLLTYDRYNLYYYTPGQQRTDQQNNPLNICTVTISYASEYELWRGTAYVARYTQNGVRTVIVYDDNLGVIARCEDDTLYYHTAVGYDTYTGTGSISVRDAHPWLAVDIDIVSLDDLRYIDMLISGVVLIDGIRLDIDATDDRRHMLAEHEYSIDVRTYCLASATEAYLTANTPDRDNEDRFIYHGDYTLRVEIPVAMGSGVDITIDNTGTYVYDQGILVADEDTTGHIHTYDQQGQVIYSGIGRLQLSNVTPDQNTPGNYNGDYIALRPLGRLLGTARIVPDEDTGDIYLYNLVTGVEIAHTDSYKVLYYESGATIYDGPGSISTPSPTPIEWRGDYTVRRDLTGYSYHITDVTPGSTQGPADIVDGTLHASSDGHSVTVEDNGSQIYSGPGSITVSNLQPTATPDVYKGDYTIVWNLTGTGRILYQYGDTYVYDLSNGDIIANESGSNVIVYDSAGSVVWQGAGWIDVTNTTPIVYEGTYIINTVDGTTGSDTIVHHSETTGSYSIERTMSGYTYHIITPTGDIELYDDGLHATMRSGTISVSNNGVQIYSGPGQILLSSVNPEDPDDPNTEYRGYYTIIWQIDSTDRAVIVDKSGNTYLYDTHGNVIARECGPDVIMSSGETYTGSITVSHTLTEDDVYIYNNNDELVAYEDGATINYIPIDPTQAWTGYGRIDTNNETLDRSIKRYHAEATGISEVNNYPSSWNIGTGSEIRLSDMALTLEDKDGQRRTYSNDPLGLLATQEYIYAGGVHSWQDWVISQDTGLMLYPKDNLSKTYDGVKKCFNLSWLTRKW